jgi:hypothetical protein
MLPWRLLKEVGGHLEYSNVRVIKIKTVHFIENSVYVMLHLNK